ncbi:MAG: protein-tyrosine phosphatase, partial [Actinomycetota bacterium]|nr:protein-tyrosine phosphatase [Actinomycetota bacterium]
MTGLVDIHAHLLPGIDDGPGSIAESVEMARAAVASGTEILATTPHLRSDFPDVHVSELADQCARMTGALEEAGVQLQLVSAAEVSLGWALEAADEELRLASY